MKPHAFTASALIALLAVIAPAAASGTGATAGVVVHIRNFAFVPSQLVVARGTNVRFVNDDQEAHTVTASDRSFDSGGLDTGEAWAHRFASTGTVPYFCALHPYMHGTIVVTP